MNRLNRLIKFASDVVVGTDEEPFVDEGGAFQRRSEDTSYKDATYTNIPIFRLTNTHYGMAYTDYSSLYTTSADKKSVQTAELEISIPIELLNRQDNGVINISVSKIMNTNSTSCSQLHFGEGYINTTSISVKDISTNLPIALDVWVNGEHNKVDPSIVMPLFEKRPLIHRKYIYNMGRKGYENEFEIYSHVDNRSLDTTTLLALYGPKSLNELTAITHEISYNGKECVTLPKNLMTVTVYMHSKKYNEKYDCYEQVMDFGDNYRYVFEKADWEYIIQLLRHSLIPIDINSLYISIKPSFYENWTDAIKSQEACDIYNEIEQIIADYRETEEEFDSTEDELHVRRLEENQNTADYVENGFKLKLSLAIVHRKI